MTTSTPGTGNANDPGVTADKGPDEATVQAAENYNKLARERGIADPGGLPDTGVNSEGQVPEDRAPQDRPDALESSLESSGGEADPLPTEDRADDAAEEAGPPQ